MNAISVIIPTYNRAALLCDAIDSVLSQTVKVDEIIVIDDGSTDNTAEVVKQRFGSEVTYIWQANAYLGAARNTGLRTAIGQNILWLDSDDLLTPRAIEALKAGLDANPAASAAYGSVQSFDEHGDVPAPDWLIESERPTWESLAKLNYIRSAGCVLIRRAYLDKVGNWDVELPGNEDWDMWLRLSEVAEMVCVPEVVLRYRIHGGSMSTQEFKMRRSASRMFKKARIRLAADPLKSKVARDAHRHLLSWICAGHRSELRHQLKHLQFRRAVTTLYRLGYFMTEPIRASR